MLIFFETVRCFYWCLDIVRLIIGAFAIFSTSSNLVAQSLLMERGKGFHPWDDEKSRWAHTTYLKTYLNISNLWNHCVLTSFCLTESVKRREFCYTLLESTSGIRFLTRRGLEPFGNFEISPLALTCGIVPWIRGNWGSRHLIIGVWFKQEMDELFLFWWGAGLMKTCMRIDHQILWW